MSQIHPGAGPILVLWSDSFDEAAATMIIAQLRRAARPVQLVGLTYGGIRGEWGVTLRPDLTLEAALPIASAAPALVVPCSARRLARLRHEPRLARLLDEARGRGTPILTVDGGAEGTEPCETIAGWVRELALTTAEER